MKENKDYNINKGTKYNIIIVRDAMIMSCSKKFLYQTFSGEKN